MNRNELQELINDIQLFKSEFDYVELKTAAGGCPKVLDSLSSFSNKNGGGVILFGIDENKNYELVGVYDVEDLQKQLMNQSKEMEPEVRLEIVVEDFDGKKIIAAIVPECSKDLKPCYIRTKGMKRGSYIRVGDSDELMNDYEIYNLMVSRGQAQEDKKLVLKATLNDLDHKLIKKLLDNVKKFKPKLYRLLEKESYEEQLKKLNIADKVKENWFPTIAGLLVFGLYPQQFFPALNITFLVLPHKEMGILGQNGERFLDNRKIEGNIPEMIDEVERIILRNMKQKTIIQGLNRLDIWEYPEDAIREAVRNTVIHRDYSELMYSNYIQIRMFPDRLEIESPGTLYGDVTLNNLLTTSKARNTFIITLLEDLKIVENRGSGIDTMMQTMKLAHLEPPQFKETRNSFMVTFRNHNFFTEDAVKWLSSMGDVTISDGQAAALVYVKNKERITNREYQELNSVESVKATKELRYLLEQGLLVQHGTRGGAFYTLSDENKESTDDRALTGKTFGSKEGTTVVTEESFGSKEGTAVVTEKSFGSKEGTTVVTEESFGSKEGTAVVNSETEELKEISNQALKKRLKPEVLEGLILKLCLMKPYTKNELMQILNRKEKLIREKIKKLITEGKLELTYPDNITHPKQTYYTKKNEK
ncbi:ATP-binding protein [Gottfriedia sp. NPDC057991]|uniref:ATP-binding protein n=1 Tax=Gottfriedia sp. NPDC057991 TaxID=3346298 RepID=UPI0036D9AFE9